MQVWTQLELTSNSKTLLGLLAGSPLKSDSNLFLQVDFTKLIQDDEFWKEFPLSQTSFWGCTFPSE